MPGSGGNGRVPSLSSPPLWRYPPGESNEEDKHLYQMLVMYPIERLMPLYTHIHPAARSEWDR